MKGNLIRKINNVSINVIKATVDRFAQAEEEEAEEQQVVTIFYLIFYIRVIRLFKI